MNSLADLPPSRCRTSAQWKRGSVRRRRTSPPLKTGVAAAATKEQLSAVETRVADLGAQFTASGVGVAGVQPRPRGCRPRSAS